MFARLFVLLAALVIAHPAAAADPATISAPEALKKAEAGEVTIVDIRTPEEWRQTGIAPDAALVNLYMPGGPAGFLRGMVAAVGGDKSRPVALICRTGNRSTRAAEFLAAQGFTNVFNVKEGMAGSGAGPGWLKRGLPVESCNC